MAHNAGIKLKLKKQRASDAQWMQCYTAQNKRADPEYRVVERNTKQVVGVMSMTEFAERYSGATKLYRLFPV